MSPLRRRARDAGRERDADPRLDRSTLDRMDGARRLSAKDASDSAVIIVLSISADGRIRTLSPISTAMKTRVPHMFRDMVAWSIEDRDQEVCPRPDMSDVLGGPAFDAENHGFDANWQNVAGLVFSADARADCCAVMPACGMDATYMRGAAAEVPAACSRAGRRWPR